MEYIAFNNIKETQRDLMVKWVFFGQEWIPEDYIDFSRKNAKIIRWLGNDGSFSDMYGIERTKCNWLKKTNIV